MIFSLKNGVPESFSPSKSAVFSVFLHSGMVLDRFSASEKQRDTPDSRKGNHGINDSRPKRSLSAEDPCNYVKFEKSDASPVECAHDSEQKTNSIKQHTKYFLSDFLVSI